MCLLGTTSVVSFSVGLFDSLGVSLYRTPSTPVPPVYKACPLCYNIHVLSNIHDYPYRDGDGEKSAFVYGTRTNDSRHSRE